MKTAISNIVLFLVNPFIGCLSSIANLKKNIREKDKRLLFIIISLFFALIAFTQTTEQGDVNRTYKGIESEESLFKSDYLVFLLLSKHPLGDTINELIYIITRDVRFVSFFWIFLLFLFTFLAINNLCKYEKTPIIKKNLPFIIILTITCFINFAQVCELVKQGVVTAMVFYAYTCFLLGDKKRAFIVYFISIGIHFSVLFFLPLFLVNYISTNKLLIITIISFLFQTFNLMEFVAELMSRIPGIGTLFLLGHLSESAQSFSEGVENFFKSNSTFFIFIFTHFVLVVFSLVLFKKNEWVKACLLMICILNLNYTNDHNYTRMLTMLFPFDIMACCQIMQMKQKVFSRLLMLFLIVGTFVINYTLFNARVNPEYGTAFLDGNYLNILYYPSFLYLK